MAYTTSYNRHAYTRRITGLTPGASLTWKWAHRVGGNSTGLNSALAVMEVWG